MVYISGEKAAQWNAEDMQRSHAPTWPEAQMCNIAEDIIWKIGEMQSYNTDSYLDGYMSDTIMLMRSLIDNLTNGYD